MSAENFPEVFTAVADNTEANTVEYNPPKVDLQPGVDPAEWVEVIGSWDMAPASHIGRLVLTNWKEPQPGDVVPNQSDLSRHQRAMLKLCFLMQQTL